MVNPQLAQERDYLGVTRWTVERSWNKGGASYITGADMGARKCYPRVLEMTLQLLHRVLVSVTVGACRRTTTPSMGTEHCMCGQPCIQY